MTTLYEKSGTGAGTVLELDSRRLVEEYGALLWLASINPDATVHVVAKRGRESFSGRAQFDPKRQVKEVAVVGGLPDLANYLCRAERWEVDGKHVSLL